MQNGFRSGSKELGMLIFEKTGWKNLATQFFLEQGLKRGKKKTVT
jgi:hypothetical protein